MKYKCIKQIGKEGGFGQVYECVDENGNKNGCFIFENGFSHLL